MLSVGDDFSDFGRFDEACRSRKALLWDDQFWTYGELDARAEAWRDRLSTAAAGGRPVVALDFVSTPEAIAAYLGALRSGLPLLVVEAGQLAPGTRMRDTWRPELHVAAGPDGLELHHDTTAPPPAPDTAPHPDLRLLLSTSGSTGDPKLVRLSGQNIASNASAIASYLDLTARDRAASTLPFYYSYGLSVLNSYLAAGASLYLTERSVTEAAFWDGARAAGVTSLALVPHQLDLLEHMRFTGRSCRRCAT